MKLLREVVFFLPSKIWCGVARIKNFLYDQRELLLKRALPGSFSNSFSRKWMTKSSSRVLSIGNLTMGGVGKTPLVLEFAKRLARKNKVAVVMKSYGGRIKSPARVNPSDLKSTFIYGDEPVMVAQALSSMAVPVFAGPSKSKTVRALPRIACGLVMDTLIVDDGFQHRKLYRDFNLLVLDATESLENYRCFPLGRGREDFHRGLQRAHGVIITRSNLVSERDLDILTSLVSQIPFLCVGLEIDGFEEWIPSSGEWISRSLEYMKGLSKDVSMALVTGLGRPLQLKKILNEAGFFFEKEFFFRDHHVFKSEDLPSDAEALVMTQKDAVKICRLPDLGQKLFVVQSKILWPEGSEKFLQEIEKCLQSR